MAEYGHDGNKKSRSLVSMKRSLKIVLAVLLLSISGRAFTQVDTIVWTELSPMPDNRQLAGSGYFLIDSDFYVSGGEPGGGVYYK